MQIKLVMTFVVAFLLVLFGIFNTAIVEINLFGFSKISIPIAVFVFVLFMIGAVYAGSISIIEQIKQSMKIRQLKRKLKEAKKYMEGGQEKEEAGDEEKVEDFSEKEITEETVKISRIV